MPFRPCGKNPEAPRRPAGAGGRVAARRTRDRAADVPKMLNGHAVNVQFVQERPDREVFIGYAGTARLSRSGKAVNVRIESRLMTAPLKAVQKVITGQQIAARLSSPAPIIDADREQAKSIDHDLVRSFS